MKKKYGGHGQGFLMAMLALGMTGGGMHMGPDPSKPVGTCSFCCGPIMSDAERLPNPDCCAKNECRKKWREARGIK